MASEGNTKGLKTMRSKTNFQSPPAGKPHAVFVMKEPPKLLPQTTKVLSTKRRLKKRDFPFKWKSRNGRIGEARAAIRGQ